MVHFLADGCQKCCDPTRWRSCYPRVQWTQDAHGCNLSHTSHELFARTTLKLSALGPSEDLCVCCSFIASLIKINLSRKALTLNQNSAWCHRGGLRRKNVQLTSNLLRNVLLRTPDTQSGLLRTFGSISTNIPTYKRNQIQQAETRAFQTVHRVEKSSSFQVSKLARNTTRGRLSRLRTSDCSVCTLDSREKSTEYLRRRFIPSVIIICHF